MVRTAIVASVAVWLSLGAATLGHHSVTVNFDNSKAMNLTGQAQGSRHPEPALADHARSQTA